MASFNFTGVSGSRMGDWRRHAIYFAPPQGSELARFGAAWLGWDPAAGAVVARSPDALLPDAMVAEPARYGFHATLKAPFRLTGSATTDDLDAATASLARGLAGCELRLQVAALGGFVALVPVDVPAELTALEAALVRGLARRRPDRLDARGREHLAAWGYPHVLDRFRFHMTLTGSLDAPETALRALTNATAPLIAGPMPVREVCRFSEAPDGRFHLVRRFPLQA
jgi:hypothetical protein